MGTRWDKLCSSAERENCSICLDSLNLSDKGLTVELIQTEKVKEALLFVHKRQTARDPETQELLAHAPTEWSTAWRKNDRDDWDWTTANIGLQSLTELFYNRPSEKFNSRGAVFQRVEKYIGEGRVIYLQKDGGIVVKLAEVFDEDHVRLTPYFTDAIKKEGFYALKVKYEPAVKEGHQQGWYETLKQEGLYHTDPEFEILLRPE